MGRLKVCTILLSLLCSHLLFDPNSIVFSISVANDSSKILATNSAGYPLLKKHFVVMPTLLIGPRADHIIHELDELALSKPLIPCFLDGLKPNKYIVVYVWVSCSPLSSLYTPI